MKTFLIPPPVRLSLPVIFISFYGFVKESGQTVTNIYCYFRKRIVVNYGEYLERAVFNGARKLGAQLWVEKYARQIMRRSAFIIGSL